ncbi:MAG: UTP--glucose-1-phosphate uridylyltransferase, partial [Verrucomicrobiota bacterium]
MNPTSLIQIITSDHPEIRNRSLESFCEGASADQLLAECAELDAFRRSSRNLYEQVRALFFLEAIHRYHLPAREGVKPGGLVPFEGYAHLLQRRYEEAIDLFLAAMQQKGHCDGISSALAAAYHGLGFQTLANQVRRSVRSVRGNQWMFRMGHPLDHPLRIRPELSTKQENGLYPVLRETTPVRMDLTHSAWSDIFFLGMDFPAGARVLNISVDLGVHGRDDAPKPPVEACLRVIDEPLLRLTSVDLNATVDITSLAEVFDFAKDYLGLLKAAVIAAGVVPPGIEGSGHQLNELLATLVGEGRGLELVSNVNNIPKGSRLAVSTNLLACLISACMRATSQAKSLTGPLDESERRLVAARAILGEWIGGSGGDWQDSGGVWPGIKLINGEAAAEGDPEFGISRGRLMPRHHIFERDQIPEDSRRKLQESLVLVHGGMAQNVGPILEMVTEKYLLRSDREWAGRKEALSVLEEVLSALSAGDIRAVGAATTRNFFGPIQTIIPWASNLYTETLIQKVREKFGEDFHGFWMLGGMSGGGMGFIFKPERREEAQEQLLRIMSETKRELEHSLPFAMDPVVYDFAINERGTFAEILHDDLALMPVGYYSGLVPRLLRADPRTLPAVRRAELDLFSAACRNRPDFGGMVQALFEGLLPHTSKRAGKRETLRELLNDWGFDSVQHEQIRADLKNSRIGLSQNRLPVSTTIQDVEPGDVFDATREAAQAHYKSGLESLAAGELAVVSLAAGAGSRWTQGAGVVKALHPFCKLGGRHRTFIETHLAKSRRISRIAGATIPHIFTTSYLTHGPIESHLGHCGNYNYPGSVLLSPGRAVGLRMVPTIRDLHFAWEEMPQQLLDEQQQKMRASLRTALIQWA